MRTRVLLIALLVLVGVISTTVYSQIFTEVIDENELIFKVKSIDEFFQRFNYEVNYKGEPIEMQNDSSTSSLEMKRKSLTTLLDFETFLDKDRNADSISTEFLDYVIAKGCRINYADTTWYAEAISSFKMNNKDYPITLYLQTEHVRDVIYKWVIRDVTSPLFSNLTDSVQSEHSIFPGAHGTSFITLPETINLNAQYVQSFFYKGYKPNLLTVFAYLVERGEITMQKVTKVIYHIEIGDYKVKVERYDKANSYNNGWLISEITKNND
ncbi:MAG: hypothetical protein K2H60_01450 [Muribaculaceae bacterium]|nr:hypothetical protein [Muribaculaceae bacterium]